MAFSTSLGNNLLALGDNSVAFGTCMLGTSFGQVKSASLKRANDRKLIAACQGSLRAAVMANARFELTLKTIFDGDVTAPGLGEEITFPLAGVAGRVMDVSVDWNEDGERELTIDATSWDARPAAGAWLLSTGGVYTPVGSGIGLEGGGSLELEGGGLLEFEG